MIRDLLYTYILYDLFIYIYVYTLSRVYLPIRRDLRLMVKGLVAGIRTLALAFTLLFCVIYVMSGGISIRNTLYCITLHYIILYYIIV